MARLKEKYKSELLPKIREDRGFKNALEAPRLLKIVVNMGFNTSVDKELVKAMVQDISMITGQKPLTRKARKSIANFKLREGTPVGLKVTLRGERMYEFYDRLVNVVLPRIRDFRGVPDTGFDGRGNYNMGLTDQTIFPEINPDDIKRTQGMNITVVTSARSDDDARALLGLMGMPFRHGRESDS